MVHHVKLVASDIKETKSTYPNEVVSQITNIIIVTFAKGGHIIWKNELQNWKEGINKSLYSLIWV